MITYLILSLTWITATNGVPVQQENLKSAPVIYYTPTSSQYVSNGLYPFIQYQGVTPTFGKALQSIQSPNELLFYPNTVPVPNQPIVINPQPTTVPVAKFTAPPSGLVDAIYAWFAENNVPLPEDPNKNEATPEKPDSPVNQEKIENPDKPTTSGEADVLAEADKNPNLNFPKKAITPNFKPGHQRFYILNGQPQFYGNYQPVVPRVQPVIPQLLTRSAIPTEQNFLFLQSQDIPQPNLKIKNPVTTQDITQNVVLLRNNFAGEQISTPNDIKPVRYHGQELKTQNYVFLRETQPVENPAQLKVGVSTQEYPQQQLLLGRYLPQISDVKQQSLLQQQVAQIPIHQTHYVPVEVVPPQVPIHTLQYQNQDNIQQDTSAQQVSFIHIPVDKNVQPPQYIKSILPVQNQQRLSGKQVLYLSSEAQQAVNAENFEIPENQNLQPQVVDGTSQVNSDVPPGVAALEFARYLASRQEELYSDSVVIDAKSEDENKEQESDAGDVVQAELPQEPSIAQAQPGGIALAGPGGIAATAPRGTALVGERGLAVASPHATAVAGPKTNKNENNNSRRI